MKAGPAPRSTPILAASAALLALALAFGIGRYGDPRELLIHGFYFYLWAVVAYLAWALRDDLRESRRGPADAPRRLALPAAIAISLTAATFICVQPAFRILSDDTDMADTAWSLYRDRAFLTPAAAIPRFGVLHVLTSGLPVRPGLFPFLVSLLHTVLGYDAGHCFLLNFLVSILILVAVVEWGRAVRGTAFGVIAAVLLASFPLYSLCVAAAGFDALNCLFLLLVARQIHRFLAKPSPFRLEVLMLLCVLGSQCRYETVLVVIPAALAACLRARELAGREFPKRFWSLPFLFLPAIWQRWAQGTAGLPLPGERRALFGAGYILPNMKGTLAFFLDPGRHHYPNSPLFFAAAVAGAAMAILRRGEGSRPRREAAVLIALMLALAAATQLAFIYGDPTFNLSTHYCLIYLGFAALCAAYPVYLLFRTRPGRILVPALLLADLAFHLRVAAANEFGRTYQPLIAYAKNISALKPFDPKETLLVADIPQEFLAYRYGAVDFDYANSRRAALMEGLARRQYANILVLRRVSTDGAIHGGSLAADFKQETIDEYPVGSKQFIFRLSRVLP
ncbi:MAG: glycosyltransferase family 39 protein [Elusimicrobiota bacterium]